MGTLSVRENLYFSAALRLPNSISWRKKRCKVQKIIEDLGLTACCDTKVNASDTIEPWRGYTTYTYRLEMNND